MSFKKHEMSEIVDGTSVSITYVEEIRPVLARHAKPKVSPESSVFPHHLKATHQSITS